MDDTIYFASSKFSRTSVLILALTSIIQVSNSFRYVNRRNKENSVVFRSKALGYKLTRNIVATNIALKINNNTLMCKSNAKISVITQSLTTLHRSASIYASHSKHVDRAITIRLLSRQHVLFNRKDTQENSSNQKTKFIVQSDFLNLVSK